MKKALDITSGDPKPQSKIRVIREKPCQYMEEEDARKQFDKEAAFDYEIIRPCLCERNWHRACIREHIVRNEIVAC